MSNIDKFYDFFWQYFYTVFRVSSRHPFTWIGYFILLILLLSFIHILVSPSR